MPLRSAMCSDARRRQTAMMFHPSVIAPQQSPRLVIIDAEMAPSAKGSVADEISSQRNEFSNTTNIAPQSNTHDSLDTTFADNVRVNPRHLLISLKPARM